MLFSGFSTICNKKKWQELLLLPLSGVQDETRTHTNHCSLPPQSSASTNSATWTLLWAKNGTRTRDPDLGKVVLYQLSYFRIFLKNFERKTGLEPATPTLARSCSTNWAIFASTCKPWGISLICGYKSSNFSRYGKIFHQQNHQNHPKKPHTTQNATIIPPNTQTWI